MIKCDRCNTINEEGFLFIIYRGGTSHSDKQHELDLCTNCQEELWKFLSPAPETEEIINEG
jgi:hypothetical protein